MGHGETNEQLGKGEGAAQKVGPPHQHPSERRFIGDEVSGEASGKANFLQDPINTANF